MLGGVGNAPVNDLATIHGRRPGNSTPCSRWPPHGGRSGNAAHDAEGAGYCHGRAGLRHHRPTALVGEPGQAVTPGSLDAWLEAVMAADPDPSGRHGPLPPIGSGLPAPYDARSAAFFTDQEEAALASKASPATSTAFTPRSVANLPTALTVSMCRSRSAPPASPGMLANPLPGCRSAVCTNRKTNVGRASTERRHTGLWRVPCLHGAVLAEPLAEPPARRRPPPRRSWSRSV